MTAKRMYVSNPLTLTIQSIMAGMRSLAIAVCISSHSNRFAIRQRISPVSTDQEGLKLATVTKDTYCKI